MNTNDVQSTEKNSPHMCPFSAASLTAYVAQHIDSQMQHTLARSSLIASKINLTVNT